MDRHEQHEDGTRKKVEPGNEDLADIRAQLASHGEMLKAILVLLQAEPAGDGPSLGKLLEALVAGIGEQSRYLKDIGLAIGKLGRDLPLDLVAAIDDNLDVPRRTKQDDGKEHNRNGSANGQDPS